MTTATFAGIDIGGTKIAAGLVDASGELRRRLSVPTPRSGGSAVLDAVAGLVTDLSGDAALTAVGVGAPGVIDAGTGSVTAATDTLPRWAGTEVRADLVRRLGLPVTVDNDVRAMAYGETRCGAGRGFADALYVSVGTGIGGALVRDGRLARGPHGTTGEIGHLLVPAAGSLRCGCGKRDHLEAVASGPAMAAAYRSRTGGDPIELPDIVHRMRSGDAEASATITDAATLAGRACAGLLAAVDTQVVIIGGGVARIGPEFVEPFTAALREEALPVLRDVPVTTASLGTDAPIVGAALLAEETPEVYT